MAPAQPLPPYLVNRFRGWHATTFAANRAWYRRLAEEGQRPRSMIVACCDSRIHVTSIFGADSGEFFIHRNIANLVPPFEPSGDRHGTSAALEYAVRVLRVAHVVVLGHSHCGGVAACHDMCSGAAPELAAETSFIGRWMDILRPSYQRLAADPADREARLTELGHLGVLASVENLATFPFVAEALAADTLTLHGAWLDIGSGELSTYDPASARFLPLGPS
ncbi:MAG TPA: carbonic anhydrase [Paracoccaceae bacterium]|nr:carbonic anhydrase [Paracoccaceae bacterium]